MSPEPTTFAQRVRAARHSLAASQKSPRGVSYYSIKVNRPWGRSIAAIAHVVGLTPDAVTALSGLASLCGIAVLALISPSVVSGVVAALLLASGFALDSADGQLARLRNFGSPSGEWLDHVVDCAVKLGLHAGVLLAWYSSGRDGSWLLLPLLFQVVAVLFFFGGTLATTLGTTSSGPRVTAVGDRTSAVLLLAVDHGVLCCAFLAWGARDVFAVVYLLLFLAHVAYTAIFFRIWLSALSV